ncbi:MAG: MFS transporter [Treponema sp.]|jgi:MFS family permease|nr:MFS transporter [Treponema sp.]
MAIPLSPYRLKKAREAYNYFNIFNAVSWNLLVGIVITLFALRLGASSTFIGLLGASAYLAHFMLPVGKLFASRFSIIGIFSTTWILRSISMIFAAIAPFFDYAGYRSTALLFIMIGIFSFHTLRGIGMIGNNPVINFLASGPDRGSYMTQIQITNSIIGMSVSFLVAMILGFDPPIFVFSILLIAGVVTGIISGIAMKKVPEPPRVENAKKRSFPGIFKEAFSQDALRHFLAILFLVALVSGVTRTFVVVYAREVFGHNDGLISLYSVFGGLGFLMVGLIVKFLVDRLGAKPLFWVSVITGLISLLPVIFFPASALENVTGTILLMVFVFFMLNFGFLGSEGIAQTYFMGLIPPEKMLDMSILYFFIFGIAGAGGTFLSGLFLDFLHFIGVSPFISFKILFGIMITLIIITLAMQKKMKPLGSLPLRNALEVIFSARDLRAISILDKLDKAQDSKEEEVLIGALHDTPSPLVIDGLLDRTRSPRLATRLESVRALEKLETLSKNAEKVLIDDVVNNPYTTAYISARILGNQNCKDAIPLLREFAVSNDYMLAGEALIALARMNDEDFRQEIERIILNTENPRLKIMGAEALGIYRNAHSIPVLFDILRGKNPPLYLRDEVVLAISAILDTQGKFYKILVRYMANNSHALMLANDEVEFTVEYINNILSKKKTSKNKLLKNRISLVMSFAETFHKVVNSYIKDKDGVEISQWILELPDGSKTSEYIKQVFSETAVDEDLSADDCLRLLIVHWAAQELRVWAAITS